MLVISGADLVGKTTFVDACVKLLQNRGLQHMKMHLSRPPASFDYYMDYVDKMSVTTVWDRFHLDSLAYRQHDDHECQLTPLRWDLVQAEFIRTCGYQVVLVAREEAIRRRYAERGDTMYGLDHILRVNEAFRKICDGLRSTVRVRGAEYRYRIDEDGDVEDELITPESVVANYVKRLEEYALLK